VEAAFSWRPFSGQLVVKDALDGVKALSHPDKNGLRWTQRRQMLL
jgi:hypothetical protein